MSLLWDKTQYDNSYILRVPEDGSDANRGQRPKLMVHYHHHVMRGIAQWAHINCKKMFGVPDGARVCLIGGGFGWSAEVWRSNGHTVAVTDTSDYILGGVGSSEEQEFRDAMVASGWNPDSSIGQQYIQLMLRNEPDNSRTKETIQEEDLSTKGSRNKVRNSLGGNIDWVITELVLESFSDVELFDIVERAHKLADGVLNIGHFVSLRRDDGSQTPDLNWKTAQQWRALLDSLGFAGHKLLGYHNSQRFELL